MDTSQWGDGQLMQLPDWCFGRRWPITGGATITAGLYGWVLHPSRLPERMVVWSAFACVRLASWATVSVGFKLSDTLAVDLPTFQAQESIFKELYGPHIGESELITGGIGTISRINMRHLVRTTSRRLSIGFYNPLGTNANVQAGIVISSVPRSVPDWLFKVSGESQVPR